MKTLMYAAALALLAVPSAAFAQFYPGYAPAYPFTYAAPYAGYGYVPTYQNYPAPYPVGSSRWGYDYYYGSSAYPTWSASASSHPAVYGGSGQLTYHPGYGWGY